MAAARAAAREEGAAGGERGRTHVGVNLCSCPYCGEPVTVVVDEGGGEEQRYVEDCPVCCRPWEVEVTCEVDGEWAARLRTADE